MVKKSFFLSPMYQNFAFYCCFKKQFSQKNRKQFLHLKKSKKFPKLFARPSFLHFCKKKRAAFGGELVVSGDGGGRWGMVSQGRGYDFDVCARLEISTTTPSSIFSKFFTKISKSGDCTGVFYCLK